AARQRRARRRRAREGLAQRPRAAAPRGDAARRGRRAHARDLGQRGRDRARRRRGGDRAGGGLRPRRRAGAPAPHEARLRRDRERGAAPRRRDLHLHQRPHPGCDAPVSALRGLTPREVVAELDLYIVGQRDAKRAVAVALRNRWRRQHVPEELRDEIAPKNIIMIGPTGVGKTEVARRLAKLAQAPFLKVEASKFTEVGYVGRDVESIMRDLTEVGVKLVLEEQRRDTLPRARERAEERLLDALLPGPMSGPDGGAHPRGETREKLRRMVREGVIDEREVEVEVEEQPAGPSVSLFTPQGVEEMGMQLKDLLGGLLPRRTRRRRLPLRAALDALVAEESTRLVDMEAVRAEAVRRVEQTGIVFI